MHPYRDRLVGTDSPRDSRWDDRVLGALLFVLGTIRVVIGLVTHEQFGAEASIAAVVAALGVLVFPWR